MVKLVLIVSLFLSQAPVISGRIVTATGTPLRDVTIQVYRSQYVDGVPRWIGVFRTNLRTDANGEFRGELPAPGTYYLSAMAPGQQSIARYYPGTPEPSQAVAIEVKSGEIVRLPDIVFSPVSTFAIRGRFIQPAGLRPRMAVLSVLRVDNPPISQLPAVRLGFNGDPELFEARVPSSGTYALSFTLKGENDWFFGTSVVNVRNADVENVTVVAVRGGTVAVRVMLNTEPIAVSQVHADPDNHAFLPAIAQGALALDRIYATTYKIGVEGLADDLYVSGIRFNGVESAVPAFTPSENALDGSLDIYVAKGSPIGGSVVDENGKAVKAATVALVPEERRRHDLYQDSPSDENGVFQLEGVAPGTYKLFAWDSVPAGAFLNADFLKNFESSGREITVGHDSSVKQSLRIIRNHQ